MNTVDQVSVLIVESRSPMRAQLRDMLARGGFKDVQSAASAGLAIRKLREANFDIILCEYHLGEGQDGQHFLEDLRHHHVIPLSTIFIMVTGEGSYERVVSAAELAPQDYILKPLTPSCLHERLMRALDKREALLPAYRQIEEGHLLDAIATCRKGESQYPQYLIDFLRLRAELHIAAGQPDQAEAVYKQVLAMRAVPWARLGLAKTMFLQKQYQPAEELLVDLVEENALYLDAYDWLARTRETAGRLAEARDTLQNAVKVSPHTVRRLRKFGEVSLELGDMESAERAIAEVVRKGKYSDFRDPEDHVTLVKAQLGLGDTAKATATLRDLERSMAGLAKTPLCKALSTAMVATRTGDTAAATTALEEAMKHNNAARASASLNLKQELARICLAHSMDSEAEEIIMDVMRHAADDAGVDRIKGMLSELGRPELGESLAGRLQDEVGDIMARGAQLAKSGDFDGAVREMMEAVHKLPGNTQVLLNAALALLKHLEHRGWNDKFADQARQFIDRVRRQDPGNARLSALTGYYHNIMKKYGIGVPAAA
jgi:DNA-binding response OmpR family regulator/Tfp pilus assembly protein PilF